MERLYFKDYNVGTQDYNVGTHTLKSPFRWDILAQNSEQRDLVHPEGGFSPNMIRALVIHTP